ncbi:trehalose-phosphatase [Stenotrophomonas mori]|uniref:Trehalose 6-phosphate phosphatase n=1 Tax=Stenotrophomonas mori TaxID=2871096 RepID=A0ABT0SDD6_9GAMM|nr:trehalose-phosphatase [Stenotrophomonas mori]MCL7713328.1 trehalose-phosphatase [Stenotrophomonas mori]
MADAFLRPPPALDSGCALFLDVDGTLVGFSAQPEDVRLPAAAGALVARVAARLDGALALVSGRPLDQLDRLFAPLRLPAAGLHGTQLRPRPGAEPQASTAASWLHDLHLRAMAFAYAHPGVRVEPKGQALALHWRNAPAAEAAVVAFAHAQLPHLPGVRLQPGNHVVELVSAGHDKGTAVAALMAAAPFSGRPPVFVGDDLTDEDGFAAAAQLGGYGILVGERHPSRAHYALPGVDAVYDWLQAGTA